VNITTAGSIATCIGIAGGNTLEALAGAWLMTRFAKGREAFSTPRDILKFAVLASGLSTMVAASAGVASLVATGYAEPAQRGAIWLTWWLGDAMGEILVAPLVIVWAVERRAEWKPRKAAEAMLLLMSLLLVSTAVFRGWIGNQGAHYPVEFMCIPLVLWAAFRFGPRETAVAIAILSGVAIRGTLDGFGPFAEGSANTSLLLLQMYLGVVALMGLAVSATVQGRNRAGLQLHANQQRLARYNADLEHFAYAASHDLQEPLRTISLFTELMVERHGKKLGADADDLLEYVVGGVKRMNAIIDGLRTYTKLTDWDSTAFEEVSMSEVVDGAKKNLEAAIHDSSTEVFQNALPLVRGDREQLIRLLQNLLGNAIKYRSSDAPRIFIEAHQRNQDWIFSVRDNGIGIDPKYSVQIFGLFKRLHGGGISGTGLGLAICKRVVELHGGRIWVESQLNEGSTFKFTIPIESE
jgi:signal transduction histidine kinase